MKKVVLFLVTAAVSCACAAPDAVKAAVAAQLEACPASRVTDIYKSFCQDHLGPEHLIPDPESARQYLGSELREYRADLAAGAYARPAERFVPCGDEGNYVRVDLSTVVDGMVPAGTLLDAFVRSANAGQNMTAEQWTAKWQEVKKVILKYFPDIPGAEEDLRELDSLMAEGHLIMHHSQAFSDAYHPHYRIIERKIFEEELLPLVDLKDPVSGLPVRKPCNLERLYGDLHKDIRQDTPDMLFVNALCSGGSDGVVGLFRERKLFWDEAPAVDSPYGRFEGLDGIREFAEGFLGTFNASSASFTPVFQTIGGGRIALEGVFKFVVDGAVEEVPFFVVTDLRTPELLEEVRMYTHYSFVPGLTPYRKPIFKPAHYEMGDPGLLTGAMRAYYEALHHAPYCDPDRIHAAFADECIVGGYDPWGTPVLSKEEMSRNAHTFGYGLSAYIPACVGMRYETIIDDGETCVIEWCHIVSKQGQQERNRIAMSGCSAYTRNADGYLCSVRISDYAGHEAEIDWTKTPVSREEAYSINLVDEFRGGCGMKPQEEY